MFKQNLGRQIATVIIKLKQGGVVIYPTETAYGLGADAANQQAVNLIFRLKHRPSHKTLPLIAGSLAMARSFCQMSKTELALAKKYWPGPLTMILKVKNKATGSRGRPLRLPLAKGIVAKNKTVAIRVSSNKIARDLSRRLGWPIVSTSANLSGAGECYSISEIKKQLGHNLDITIVDVGRLPKRKPSTIVRVKEDSKIKILRQGEIKVRFLPLSGGDRRGQYAKNRSIHQ